jgi:hypothetical protein
MFEQVGMKNILIVGENNVASFNSSDVVSYKYGWMGVLMSDIMEVFEGTLFVWHIRDVAFSRPGV